MQPPESSGDGSATPTRRQLQGPRPPQLKVRRESHSIRKPPKAPPPPPPPQPVIIYSVSPKVIHATVSDFMPLVQRLTGSSSAGDVSPAARLASIERTSPTDREKHREILISNDDDDDDAIMGGMVQVEGVCQIPGILSPAPATLPPISPGFFAPGAGSDPYSLSLFQDPYLISPSFHDNMFMLSPSSTLFSAPIVSPSPSSLDLINPFFDF